MQEPGLSRPHEGEPPTTTGDREGALVFLTDASAELEGLARKARQLGYTVVDVPLSLLRERAAVQTPAIVLLDTDAEGALDVLVRLRELPEGARVVVFAFGREGGAISGPAHAQTLGIARFFRRPVSDPELLRALEEVLGVPAPRRRATLPPGNPMRSPSQPPLMPASASAAAPSAAASSSAASSASTSASLREPHTSRSGLVSSGLVPPAPLSGSSLLPAARTSLLNPLSPELELMLAEAERRVQVQSSDAPLVSPEEEIEAVLPAELLDSLDEPIDDDDELDAIVGPARGGTGGGTSGGTGADRRTNAGDRQTALRRERERDRERDREREELELAAQAAQERAREIERERLAHEREREKERAREREHEKQREYLREHERHVPAPALRAEPDRPPPEPPPHPLQAPRPTHDSDLPPTPRDGRGPAAGGERAPTPTSRPRSAPKPPEPPRVSERPPSARLPHDLREPGKSVVLGKDDAPRVLAEAIAARLSGALAFASGGTLRRVLLREGDIVTVVSGEEKESLVAFLAARGELPQEDAEQLLPKLPPFGRHAGAALVAYGHLRQDQLWPALRAHAEWVLSICLRVSAGTAALEQDLSGRLKTEPNVFGGAPGVATFVEAVRRVFEPQAAAERLGERVKLGEGPNAKLTIEAHLNAEDTRAVERCKGQLLTDLLASSEETVPIAFALVLLGALSAVRALGDARRSEPQLSEDEIGALDEEAIRARVRARMTPVDDGDYFAVLGLQRDATGYEVRRAFLALRREFEPSRMLTPATADLREDVEHIAVVLEEAYEILRDAARRERYRRAIEAPP